MSTPTDHDIFWLARYAHNKLAPLFAEVKTLEPQIRFSIEMVFANPDRPYTEGFVTVYGHWTRKEPLMFLSASRQHSKADIDLVAELVRDKIAHLHLDAAVAELESVAVPV